MGGLIVAAIWIFIIYRIIAAANGGRSPVSGKPVKPINTKAVKQRLSSSVPKGVSQRVQKTLDNFVKTFDNETESERYCSEPVHKAASEYSSKERKSTPTKLSTLAASMEDRSHDWLAQQLKEEDYIYRHGSVGDLGASHNKTCAADSLRKDHRRACDADGVDRAEYL